MPLFNREPPLRNCRYRALARIRGYPTTFSRGVIGRRKLINRSGRGERDIIPRLHYKRGGVTRREAQIASTCAPRENLSRLEATVKPLTHWVSRRDTHTHTHRRSCIARFIRPPSWYRCVSRRLANSVANFVGAFTHKPRKVFNTSKTF